MTSETMLYAEDIEAGQEYPLGSYRLDEDDLLAFARQWDPLAIHTDPEAAAAGPHGGVIGSGIQTIAIYQRLIAQAFWQRVAGIGGRGFDVRFRKPVRPGTTLTGLARIDRVEHRPEKGTAVVYLQTDVTDDAGDVVLTVACDAVVLRRPG